MGASAVLVQRRVAVEVLVTTPESLALQLSYEDAGSRFRALGSIVVDEWHESWVVGAECCWSWAWRGCGKSRPQRRYGSVGDDRQSGGSDAGAVRPVRQGHLIAVRAPRRILIETALPPHIERFAWAGHLGLSQLGRVVEVASAARTVLVFTNTRSQAELWHEALASVWPHPPETLGIHHGSLDRGLRRKVEDDLRSGAVRCVVATSSLDLGVDFSSVDAVIQIGSTRGIARLLQRAGRSNHRPGEIGRILPKVRTTLH